MRTVKYIAAFVAALALGACGGPKIVPNERLALVFHDIYLTNAYAGQSGIKLDSLNIYEPVFAKYGYTSEDIQFTIGSFSKRKSARLSTDVVDRAIEMLQQENRFWAGRIAMADTLVQIARKRYARTVYTDTLIKVSRIADTALLRIEIPVEKGSYNVSYSYLVDSVDTNILSRGSIYLVDERGVQSNGSPRRFTRGLREKASTTFTTDNSHRSLVLDLNGYPEKNVKTPSMRIDTLVVTHYPPDSVALARMSRIWFNQYILDSMFRRNETHLVTPLVDTTRVASE